MSVRQSDGDAAEQARSDQDSLQYPTNHVVAILDTQDQTARALDVGVRPVVELERRGLVDGRDHRIRPRRVRATRPVVAGVRHVGSLRR